jgi:hypothetical protein
MLKFREERYAGRYAALSLSEGWMGYTVQYVHDSWFCKSIWDEVVTVSKLRWCVVNLTEATLEAIVAPSKIESSVSNLGRFVEWREKRQTELG